MRVGYFVETPVEHNLTGGVRSFLNLAEELLKLGVEPYVVTSEEWAFTDLLKQMGIPYLVSRMYRPFVGVTDHVRFEREKYWIKTIINDRARRRAIKWFRENGIQLVHINSQFAGVVGAQVAQKLNIPYVYHMREYLDKDFGVTFYSDKLVQKYIVPAARVIAISQSIQKHYEQKLGRGVDLVYNGLPVSASNHFDCSHRLNGETLNCVIVGRVNEAKGQFEAVRAMKLLKDTYGHENICLHIVGCQGDSPYEQQIVQYMQENSLSQHVILHPFTNTPEQILKDCDVGLTCSVAEAFGRVTVEYMLAGLFTIGANTGGTPEIILDGESGLLYEQGSAQDLAQKLDWVLRNKDAAACMLRMGQQRALDVFSIQSTAQNVQHIYEDLLNGK